MRSMLNYFNINYTIEYWKFVHVTLAINETVIVLKDLPSGYAIFGSH